jgi:hypothetical protein
MTKGRDVPPRQETAEQAQQRYLHHAHRVQAGVGMLLELDGSSATPKHVRTGINTGKVEHGALVDLLVRKGIITSEEYLTQVADAMEREADRYERELSEKLGSDIKLKSLY